MKKNLVLHFVMFAASLALTGILFSQEATVDLGAEYDLSQVRLFERYLVEILSVSEEECNDEIQIILYRCVFNQPYPYGMYSRQFGCKILNKDQFDPAARIRSFRRALS